MSASNYNLRKRKDNSSIQEYEERRKRRCINKTLTYESESEDETFSKEESSDSESEYSNSENEYFELDKDPLIKAITEKIKGSLSDYFTDDDLEKVIQTSIKKAKDDLISEYCGVTPRDEKWKINLEKSEIDKLEPRLKNLRLEIEKDEPDIGKILRANIFTEDKKRALILYDILQNTEPYTYDYEEIKKDINKILKTEKSLQNKDIQKMEKQEKNIKEKIGEFGENFRTKILSLDVDEKIKAHIYELYLEFSSTSPSDSEHNILKQKLIWATSLPHKKMSFPEKIIKNKPEEVQNYCSKIYQKLDEKLYGMKRVKERMIEIVNNRIYNPKTKSMIAFKGPAGVGKTRAAKVLAESMDLPFEKISLGGLEDPSILKGTDNSWVGSSPSIILQILRKMKVCNGVILFDEIDKLGKSERGLMVQYALLHITDYTQNSEFQDLFLSEFPHDLSNIWFMFAMNNEEWLDPILRDRLDIIEVKKYSSEEITKIIQKHILPETLVDVGLNKKDCVISDAACLSLQSLLSSEINLTGIRPIEKEVHRIVSKINMLKNKLHSGGKSELELSYSLLDFEGFPYKITTETVTRLWSNTNVNTDYLNMYL